jgi:hypothetical protein
VIGDLVDVYDGSQDRSFCGQWGVSVVTRRKGTGCCRHLVLSAVAFIIPTRHSGGSKPLALLIDRSWLPDQRKSVRCGRSQPTVQGQLGDRRLPRPYCQGVRADGSRLAMVRIGDGAGRIRVNRH